MSIMDIINKYNISVPGILTKKTKDFDNLHKKLLQMKPLRGFMLLTENYTKLDTFRVTLYDSVYFTEKSTYMVWNYKEVSAGPMSYKQGFSFYYDFHDGTGYYSRIRGTDFGKYVHCDDKEFELMKGYLKAFKYYIKDELEKDMKGK